ncbi:CYTH and CHAD domain-containing protein [Nakamurella deserti]|uniref:CYTH and CHAD domain-containing protein n=1 Tax=Nakamurella deserti TaxID=2164074 RepID=UPI000DBE7562|nr:CYTH and CHAD domain-containing protein [Nakamurella deserti]
MAPSPLHFDVRADTAVPDLADLPPEGGRWEVGAASSETRYLDTAAHDLTRAGAALARTTGDSGAGWRLELPGRPPQYLVDRPRATVTPELPAALAAATVGVRRGREVAEVATVRIHRTVHRLVDAAGDPLVELADETVHTAATTADGVLLEDFRRWVLAGSAAGNDGVAPVVDAVAARLTGTDGAVFDPAPGTDLQRALVGHPGAATTPPPSSDQASAGTSHKAGGTEHAKGRKGSKAQKGKAQKGKGKGKAADGRTAGELILAYLRAQDDALIAGDLVLRARDGGIHPTRVATRRLRSTLRIFRPFVDADRAAAFDAELSWYAATLGEVRDREVQRVRMRALLDEIPDDLVLGPVGSSIDAVLRSEEVLHRGRLAEAMDSDRYLALLREAHLWSTTPPFTARADDDAEVLTGRVDKAAAKLVAHLEAGLRAGGDDEELHSARKAGKRARYAAELAAPVLGKEGAKLVSRYEEVQDVLGDFQDGVVACALIRRLATGTVGKRKENGFTYGLLYARERERAVEGRRRADALFAGLRD